MRFLRFLLLDDIDEHTAVSVFPFPDSEFFVAIIAGINQAGLLASPGIDRMPCPPVPVCILAVGAPEIVHAGSGVIIPATGYRTEKFIRKIGWDIGLCFTDQLIQIHSMLFQNSAEFFFGSGFLQFILYSFRNQAEQVLFKCFSVLHCEFNVL